MTDEEALKQCKEWFNSGGIGMINAVAFNIAINALEYTITNKQTKIVRCYQCKYYNKDKSLCFRKSKFGGIHSVDSVSKRFYCANGAIAIMTNLQLLKKYINSLPDFIPKEYEFNQNELKAASGLSSLLSGFAYNNNPTDQEALGWLLSDADKDDIEIFERQKL